MNEQIKELAEQAEWWKPLGLPSDWDDDDYIVSPEQAKKFARLIIQACLEQCAAEKNEFSVKAAENNGRESDFAFGSVTSAERIEAAIKQQFGIL